MNSAIDDQQLAEGTAICATTGDWNTITIMQIHFIVMHLPRAPRASAPNPSLVEPSSADNMMTLRFGGVPSPHGHWPVCEIVEAMKMESWLFPSPGSPPTSVVFPMAMRPGQSHSTGSGLTVSAS